MFDELLVNQKIDKDVYEKEIEIIRQNLLKAQYQLLKKDFNLIIIFTGDDRIGATRMLNTFYEWLDARYLNRKVFGFNFKRKKLKYPFFYQFWKHLPPKGEIAFFINEWNSHYLAQKVLDKKGKIFVQDEVEQILAFEKMLSDDNTLILKFWLHIGKEKLQERVENAQKNPEDYWWVKKNDLILYENYDKVMENADNFVRQTDHASSRWHIINSTDFHARNLQVANIVLNELNYKINNTPKPKKLEPLVHAKIDVNTNFKTILDDVDLTQKISYDEYKSLLKIAQKRISLLMNKAHKKKKTNVILLEGWDAAGKGGVIRRLIYGMDAQYYEVVQFAAPTAEELRYNYMHRFWQNLPSKGQTKIFDRSWYGRVLVERIEGFADENEWERAFSEITHFEHQLHKENIILHKFWLHISPEEQFKRFKKRETISYKNYKITDDDYRNREKWDYYKLAFNDVVLRTSTQNSPWHIIAAEDKKFARLEVLRLVAERIENEL